MEAIVLLNLIIPFVMLLVSYILEKKPVTNMNSNNGYCTPTAKKSKEHWQYAQSIAPAIYMSLGKTLLIIELIISVALLLLKMNPELILIIGMCIGFGFLFLAFYTTDNKIEEKFK